MGTAPGIEDGWVEGDAVHIIFIELPTFGMVEGCDAFFCASAGAQVDGDVVGA